MGGQQARVSLCDGNELSGRFVVAGHRAGFDVIDPAVQADLSHEAGCVALVEAAGGPDVLVHSAGIWNDGAIRELSVERLELKSIVSVPFRLGDVVMGALYLDNPARKGQFGTGDLQFLTALGDQAALAIRNLQHAQQMQQQGKLNNVVSTCGIKISLSKD